MKTENNSVVVQGVLEQETKGVCKNCQTPIRFVKYSDRRSHWKHIVPYLERGKCKNAEPSRLWGEETPTREASTSKKPISFELNRLASQKKESEKHGRKRGRRA